MIRFSKKWYMSFMLIALFGINLLEGTATKQWSILICTLEERKESFALLHTKLLQQINDHNLQDQVELLYFLDNRQHTIGHKRNYLLQHCSGKYVCFIDDDDDVHDDYIAMIYKKLLNDPDCVSLVGLITICDDSPKLFIHSIKYTSWFETSGIYYRPPNHLNPIRKGIAQQFVFPERNRGEDSDWSMQIAASGLIKTEEYIDEPYYFYTCNHRY